MEPLIVQLQVDDLTLRDAALTHECLVHRRVVLSSHALLVEKLDFMAVGARVLSREVRLLAAAKVVAGVV